jgi:hypothetical protein
MRVLFQLHERQSPTVVSVSVLDVQEDAIVEVIQGFSHLLHAHVGQSSDVVGIVELFRLVQIILILLLLFLSDESSFLLHGFGGILECLFVVLLLHEFAGPKIEDVKVIRDHVLIDGIGVFEGRLHGDYAVVDGLVTLTDSPDAKQSPQPAQTHILSLPFFR